LRAPAAAAPLLLAGAALLAGCGGSPPTEDNVVYAVPDTARAYVHLDRESGDWRAARDALRRMPALASYVLDAASGRVRVPGNGEAGVALLHRPVVFTPKDRAARRSLAELPEYRALLAGLPDQRFVHVWAGSRAVAPLRSIDRSITAAAASADVDGDRMRIHVRVHHDDVVGPCSAGRGDSSLLDAADPKAALYLEVPSIACAMRALAAHLDGAGAALGRFARAAQRRGHVSLEKELLPLLDRRGALIASPGKRGPTITLVVDGVDETQALDVLAGLQPALIEVLRTERLGQAATFSSAEVEGVTAATARLAPGLELSYAAFDGRLVVSTSLDGIAAVRRSEGLGGTDAFESVLGDRPSNPSALLFLDLDQLLALGEQAGLAEDPRYLAIRDDLQKLRAAGAVLSREEEFTTAELTFQIP
jgi:hypothetical protein